VLLWAVLLIPAPASAADSEAIIAQLKNFVHGPEQQARFSLLVDQLDSTSFIEREQALHQLRLFPNLPGEQLESASRFASPEAQFKLTQLQAAQSEGRTHQLIRTVLTDVTESPQDIPLPLVLRVIETHSHGMYAPLAQRAVTAVSTDEEIQLLTDALQHELPLLRTSAAHALAARQGKAAIAQLSPLLKDPNDVVKLEAAFLLINLGQRGALDTLILLTDSAADLTRWRSKHLLSRLLGVNLQEEQEPKTNFAPFWRDILARNPNQALRIPVAMPSDIPLFEDAALSGWVEILNGVRQESPQSWSYDAGILTCSGEGRGYLITQRKFKNYELVLEWKSDGDSGVGIMAIKQEDPVRGEPPYLEVQTLPTSVGDLYIIGNFSANNSKGAPISFREKRLAAPPEPQSGWYQLKIVVKNGTAEISVNDTVVNKATGGTTKPGHIVLRNEGDAAAFKNLLIRPLDSYIANGADTE
jgi:hypothetical protein